MDTYGGAVNDADDIRTRTLDFEIPLMFGSIKTQHQLN